MNRKWVLYGGSALVLALSLAVGFGYAQGPAPSRIEGPMPSGRHPQAPLGVGFTYQGRLRDSGGSPLTDTCDFAFGLWDAESGGNPVGSESVVTGVEVVDGYFAALVNSSGEFGSSAFAGEARWLEVAVQCLGDADYSVLSPRQQLTAAPYARYSTAAPWSGIAGMPAGFADDIDDDILSGLSCASGQIAKWNGAIWACATDETGGGGGEAWLLSGNAGTNPSTHFLGTTDAVTLVLAVSGTVGLRLEPTTDAPNLIGGDTSNSTAAGVTSAVIGGGSENHASGGGTVIGGGWLNLAGGDLATVGGGGNNQASGDLSTVAGGGNNTASIWAATVSGGQNNSASGNTSTVAGGYHNEASGPRATIGGGESNLVTATHGTIAGGYNITVTGDHAAVGGGENNSAVGDNATIGGGLINLVTATCGTIGGGYYNQATAIMATVGGGQGNDATAYAATVAGGQANEASNDRAVVGGGEDNIASGPWSTIVGGWVNAASGSWATVTGGRGNSASGQYSIALGGRSNAAQGDFGLAAGRRAKALHAGTFVWADSSDFDFSSSNSDQFSVRATGGVRFVSAIDGPATPRRGYTWLLGETPGQGSAIGRSRRISSP